MFRIYYRESCPYSRRALAILQSSLPSNKLEPIITNNVTESIHDLKNLTGGHRTVPAIFYFANNGGKVFVGGCDSLVSKIEKIKTSPNMKVNNETIQDFVSCVKEYF